MSTKWNVIDWVAVVLVIVGGVNWGLIGLFDFNLVEALFGPGGLSAAIYTVVGLAALFMVYSATKAGGMTERLT